MRESLRRNHSPGDWLEARMEHCTSYWRDGLKTAALATTETVRFIARPMARNIGSQFICLPAPMDRMDSPSIHILPAVFTSRPGRARKECMAKAEEFISLKMVERAGGRYLMGISTSMM